MRKDEYEIQEKMVKQKVITKKRLFCDKCKKEIENGAGYYEVTINHEDRGSCFGTEDTFDLCSKECLNKNFQKYCNKTSKSVMCLDSFYVEHCNWVY